ncbi:hypothetical protein QAD02_023682 [Eretmocerus hayati]|uniref:Uncharacterized protein n=1 Tax=Eretmocerus hayati TaxID=131215 RepID=A0ACC2PWX4_9HYME|nr:hypothetical protein QAD02_023682 [Eretmocerus hayati]
MQTQYIYVKKRSEFGKRCYFNEFDKLEVDIRSDPSLAKDFIYQDPVSRSTQNAKVFAVHEVNTTTATFKDSGMRHVEGGWPKDINKDDGEQTMRYRRKIEKDEMYVHTMLQLLPGMEHCVLQNTACDIYEKYFEDVEPTPLVQRTWCRTVNVYRDQLPVRRPVNHVSWSPDHGSRIAVTHCSTDFNKLANYSPMSYIWDVSNPNKPFAKLMPFCPLLTLEFNPKDSNVLASGMSTGQVAVWDIRRSQDPIDLSPAEVSHRDPCDQVLWINSKTGTEFFSAAKDGQVNWWDTRKLQEPLENLVMDLINPEEQQLDRAIGVSSLQFEPSIGTRFMCGLENGTVISGNRKGKTATEKLQVRFKAHHGPVISVTRNPNFVKNFLTVGDWTARVWSEDCRESSIVWTPGHEVLLTNGAWSETRFSVFFLTRADGTMDAWDLLVQQDKPVLGVKVCDEALTCIKPHEAGRLVAVGSKNGTLYMLELSDTLSTNQKNDKAMLTAMLDRETRREKVIESKNREMRLKMKTTRQESVDVGEDGAALVRPMGDLDDPVISQCEQEYNATIEAEKARQADAATAEVSFDTLLIFREFIFVNLAYMMMKRSDEIPGSSSTMPRPHRQQLPKLKRRGTLTRSARAIDEDDSETPSSSTRPSPSLTSSDLGRSPEHGQPQESLETEDIHGSKASLINQVQSKLRSSMSTSGDDGRPSPSNPQIYETSEPTPSTSTSVELKSEQEKKKDDIPEPVSTLSRGSRIAQSIKRRFGFFRSKKHHQKDNESTIIDERQDVEKAQVSSSKDDEVDGTGSEDQMDDDKGSKQRLVDVVVDVHRGSEALEKESDEMAPRTNLRNRSAGRRRWRERSQEDEEQEDEDGDRPRTKPRRKQWDRIAQDIVRSVVDRKRLRPVSARPRAAPRSKSLQKENVDSRLHEGFDNEAFSSDHDEFLRIETINDHSPKIKLGSDERADKTADGISTLSDDEANQFIRPDPDIEETKDYVPEVVISSDNSDVMREVSPSELNESSNNTSSEKRRKDNLLVPSKRHRSGSGKRKLSADRRSYHEEEDDDDAEDEEEQETVLNMMDKKSKNSLGSSKIEMIPSNFFEKRSSDETTISTNEDMNSPQRLSSHRSHSTAKSSRKSHRTAKTRTGDSDEDPLSALATKTKSRKHSRSATTASSSAAGDEDDDDYIDNNRRNRKSSSESWKKAKSRKHHTSRKKRDESGQSDTAENKIEEIDDTNIDQESRKFVGVTIHRSDVLEPDYVTRHPMVRVHIIEVNTGDSPNSDADIPEPLAPQITTSFDFKSNRSMMPVWEQQLVFEMNFERLLSEGSSPVVLLFEMVDLLGANDPAFRVAQATKDDCWWKVAWAFLRPVGSGGAHHVNKRLRLQLYRPQRSFWRNTLATATRQPKSKCEVYRWWKSGAKERYPGSLHVSISGVDPSLIESAVLYEQLTLSGDRVQASQSEPADSEAQQPLQKRKTSIIVGVKDEDEKIEKETSKWTRLAAQSCQIPNEQMLELEPGDLGCFCLAFSHDGKLLACGLADRYHYPIVVYEVEDGRVRVRFSGHKNFVYALSWSHDDHYLLSVSSDQTARFWDVKEKIIEHVQSLPHPSYVYCGAWQPSGLDYVVTGCYDRVIRLWQRSSDSKSRSRRHSRISRASTSSNIHNIIEVLFGYELTQELEAHTSFVSAICLLQASDEAGHTLVTGDGLGALVVWSQHRFHHRRSSSARRSSSSNTSTRQLRSEWRVFKEIGIDEAEGTPVNAILAHPRPGPNALVVMHSRNGGLWLVEALSGNVVRQFHGLKNHRMQIRGCISPCGSLLFCGNEDSSLNTWSIDSGKLLATYYPPPANSNNTSSNIQNSSTGGNKANTKNTVIVSCVDYHPYDHLLAHSSFGGFSPVRLLRYSRDSDGSQLGLRLHRQEPMRKISRVSNGLVLSPNALMAEAPRLNGFAKNPGHPVSMSNHRARSLNRLNGIIEKIDRILQYASGQQQNQRQIGQLQDDPEIGLQADLQLDEFRPVMAAPSIVRQTRPKSARQPRRRKKADSLTPKAQSDSAVLVRPFAFEDDEIDDDAELIGERLRLESQNALALAAQDIVQADVASSGDDESDERIELERLDVQSLESCSSSASVAADDTYNVDVHKEQDLHQNVDVDDETNRAQDNSSELSNATFVIESELQEDHLSHQPVPRPRVRKTGPSSSPPASYTTKPTPTPRRIEVV